MHIHARCVAFCRLLCRYQNWRAEGLCLLSAGCVQGMVYKLGVLVCMEVWVVCRHESHVLLTHVAHGFDWWRSMCSLPACPGCGVCTCMGGCGVGAKISTVIPWLGCVPLAADWLSALALFQPLSYSRAPDICLANSHYYFFHGLQPYSCLQLIQ